MSLSGYVNSINDQLALLRKDVRELKQENKELKAQLTHAHHGGGCHGTTKPSTPKTS
eukprot:COSAG06_NODE_4073_length_4603_cov_10.418295_3_plen_57_part_00